MRVVKAAEMQELDRVAIEDYGIPGVVLMENAGIELWKSAKEILGDVKGKYVIVIAGKGNNGGDGFVVARHLYNNGASVKIFLLADQSNIKGDAGVNLNIWLNMGGEVSSAQDISPEALSKELGEADLIIDALYGTGFKGKVREHIVPVVESVNASSAPVIAVDIPSGLEADTGKVNGPCIRARSTVTFALPKLGLVTGDGPEFTGDLRVADISIPCELLNGGDKEIISEETVKGFMPFRRKTGHKGDFGHALLAGGSPGMSGAITLSALACARSGAGLVTAAVPVSIHDIAENKLTEVMTVPLAETIEGFLSLRGARKIKRWCDKVEVMALGPGLGVSNDTIKLVEELLGDLSIPCVIDADGLNALARSSVGFNKIKPGTVLTPHPGEIARLLGCSTAEIESDRLKSAISAAEKFEAILVLKGAGTIVATPEGRTYINITGNSGMATGGCGDVLTGLITGLIAQGCSPEGAAVAGVYLHGLAGNLAAEKKGKYGMLAGDMIDELPETFKIIEKDKT